MENNAKDKASGVRTAKRPKADGNGNPGRQEGTGEPSGNDGGFSIGATGEVGAGEDSDCLSSLTGGVIEQLILDAQDRLKNAEECIDWYERERDKELNRLGNLEKLRQMAEHLKQKNQQSE